jgi:ERCC4-type nuclease|tara:strand:+ start:301 stop:996 length:696 start_codon:yes stop_codon:yes gene_type:complete
MLIIDSREKEGSKLVRLVEQKAKALNIKTEKKWIEIGDYVFNDVCFEAKSTTDFLGSVISKRMWTQIDNMDRAYKTNIVLIYGNLQEAINNVIDNSPNNMPRGTRGILLRNKFLGAYGRIVLDMDTKPMWVESEEEAAEIITAVCKMQPLDRPSIKPRIHKRLATDDLRVDMLSTIKGVSESKAERLIKEFGCIMEIGEQKAYEITKMEGIGPTVANRILDTLNSEDKVRV